MAKRDLPTPDYLRQCLDYDPETGALMWKARPADMFEHETAWKRWNGRHAGTEAFTTNRNGYRVGVVNWCCIYAHRAIWAMVYGYWPDIIDHINGDRSGNWLANLREVDSAGNMKNVAVRSDNTSGVTGVYRNCPRYKLPWAAEIYENGRKLKIGNFSTIEEAAAARRKAEAIYGYHENHGCR